MTRIHNNYFSSDIDIVFLELVPWYCRVFLHTLAFSNSKNKPVKIGNLDFSNDILIRLSIINHFPFEKTYHRSCTTGLG